ncbi:YqhG/Tai3 family protein [Capnocytophaga sp. HP1101]
MKTRFFIIGLFLITYTQASAQTQKAITTLKEFYTVVYDDALDSKENLFQKYVSKELLNNVFPPSREDASPGYDPFIQAQDYDAKSIHRSLSITPLGDEKYRVCFLLSNWEKKRTCVEYQLKKNSQGNYIIANILSDKNFYIKPKKK